MFPVHPYPLTSLRITRISNWELAMEFPRGYIPSSSKRNKKRSFPPYGNIPPLARTSIEHIPKLGKRFDEEHSY
jgi:hypothetical protein